MKVYSNGEVIDKDVCSEIFESGYLFGWGVFEPFRVYGGKIPFLPEHISRLNKSLKSICIEPPEVSWQAAISNLLEENKLSDAYVRITVYKKRKDTGVLIYTDTFTYYTDETYSRGFTSLISPYQRNSAEVSSKIKSLSYLQNRLSWFCAQKAGKGEALVLNEDGFVVGGARSNLFLIKGSNLLTAPLKGGAFCGITRGVILNIAAELGLTVEECSLKRELLHDADEAFLTSALLEAMPLVECEGKAFGDGRPGELTGKILARYRSKIKEA